MIAPSKAIETLSRYKGVMFGDKNDMVTVADIIELLKLQVPVPVQRWNTNPFSPFCPNVEKCGYPLEEGQPFCWHCGQAIKWE